MSALVQVHDHLPWQHLDRGRDVEQVAEDLLGCRLLVLPPNPRRQQPVQTTGHQRDLQVEVHLQAHHRGQGIKVEELDCLGDAVLDQHALGIAGHQRHATGAGIVGQQESRFLMAQVDDADLPQRAGISWQGDTLVEDAWRTEGAGQRRQGDAAPRRRRQAPDVAQQRSGAAAQRQEKNVALVQLVEELVGGQLRIEDQLCGRVAAALLPEIGEADDLGCLFGLGNAGMGVAHDAGGGVTDQEDLHALLTAAAAGNIVFFQRFLSGVGGYGMEVEIERIAAWQAGPVDFVGPGSHQAGRGTVIDPRTVTGQVGTLGHRVEPSEQSDAWIANQIHDVAGTFGADELEGQQGAQGLLGGDHGRAGQVGLAQDLGQANSVQERHEEKEPTQACAERAGFQTQGAHIGDGGRFGAQRRRPFLVEASGQAGEAFFAQEHAEGVDADGVPGVGEFALDVVDGQVAFAHGDDEFADRIANRGIAWSVLHDPEEAGAFVGIVAKLMAKDAEGAGGIAEAACDFVRRQPPDEKGTERFILTVEGAVGSEKEAGVFR